MRTAAIVLAVVLAGCPGKSATGPREPVSHTPAEVVDAATQVVESWRQAWEVRSADALKALYAHDVDVVIVSQGQASMGWTAVDAFLDTEIGAAASVHMTVSDLSVAALGPAAASLVCSLTREISDGVSTASEHGTLTMALRDDGDGWVIVAEHYSFPPSAQ